jgi:two-component system, LuxR family, sensor kinase FixL
VNTAFQPVFTAASSVVRTKRVRVLIVDDDRVDIRALVRFVDESALPFDLTTASSLVAARECIATAAFDVAIVDHELGDGTGLALFADLGDTPVIVLTGAGTEQTAATALALRASHYMIKDADRGYLHLLPATIEHALNRKWTERELRRYADELKREIVQRRSVEESLRSSEERLRQAVTAASVGIWEWDTSTDEVYWSDEVKTIFGLPLSEVVLQYAAFFDRVHPDDRAAVSEWIAEALREDVLYRVEHRIVRPDGKTRWVLSQGRIFRDEARNPLRMIGAILDITDRKEAEERLQRHQADVAHVSRLSTMGELATGLAHEINQPLSAIRNYANGCVRRLRNCPTTASELLEAVEQIAIEAHRAAEIIRRLRRFVEKGRHDRRTVDVNELVREVLQLTAFNTRQHGVAPKLALAEGLPSVFGDSIQLEQVILNLLRNALEAMDNQPPAHRELSLESRLHEQNRHLLEIVVRDTGTGFPAADVDRIFDPCFTTKANGLGMGLTISRSIVESHGGRLWADPSPTGGAVFRLTLPVLPQGIFHES